MNTITNVYPCRVCEGLLETDIKRYQEWTEVIEHLESVRKLYRGWNVLWVKTCWQVSENYTNDWLCLVSEGLGQKTILRWTQVLWVNEGWNMSENYTMIEPMSGKWRAVGMSQTTIPIMNRNQLRDWLFESDRKYNQRRTKVLRVQNCWKLNENYSKYEPVSCEWASDCRNVFENYPKDEHMSCKLRNVGKCQKTIQGLTQAFEWITIWKMPENYTKD